MSVLEIITPENEYSRQYRIGHFLTIVACLLALLYGINTRSSILSGTTPYRNVQFGIAVNYPQNWLIDTDGDYVLRVRDMTRIGYKTTMQIAIRPIGGDMTERNVFDNLNLVRSRALSTYDVQSTDEIRLTEDVIATAMTYTFVDTATNKFLQTVPTVVTGRDILIIRGEQAIVVTFRSGSDTFEDDIAIFDRILSTLEY
jgi:hypothetical protein